MKKYFLVQVLKIKNKKVRKNQVIDFSIINAMIVIKFAELYKKKRSSWYDGCICEIISKKTNTISLNTKKPKLK